MVGQRYIVGAIPHVEESVDTLTDCGDEVHCLYHTSVNVMTFALCNFLPEFLVVHWLSSSSRKPEPYIP